MIFGKSHHYAVVLALSAFLAVPLVGCGGGGGTDTTPPIDATARATFIGLVLDYNNESLPVPGAQVSFNGVSVFTASDGSFTLNAPANTGTVNATVVGPNNNFYSTGIVNGVQYNTVSPGFPVPSTAGGASRDLGVIKIGNQSGPPPPPPSEF